MGIKKASEFLDKLLYYFFGEEETSNLCSSAAESVFILLLRSFSKGDSSSHGQQFIWAGYFSLYIR